MHKHFAVGSIVNLCTLLVGLCVGFLGGTIYVNIPAVNAQIATPPQQVEDVTPTMTVPSLGTNLLLAHEIAADTLVVNGYDVLKLENGILNYLASRPLAEKADIQNIVNGAKAEKTYRIKANTEAVPPPATQPTPSQEKPKP